MAVRSGMRRIVPVVPGAAHPGSTLGSGLVRMGHRRCGVLLAVGLGLAPAGCAGSTSDAPPAASIAATSRDAAVAPGPSTDAATPGTPEPTTPPVTAWTGGPVLAAKIDNTARARPRIGVGQADVVYVEPVEAGLTRLLAVWSTHLPARIGPIRSARESDLDLLGNYGPVAFAFSGGSAATLATLATGTQVDLPYDASHAGYTRDPARPAPYDLVGEPAALLARAGGSGPPGAVGIDLGVAPPGGEPVSTVATAWASSAISFAWDGARAGYRVWVDGSPDVDADGSQHLAATVVVQRVETTLGGNRDVNGVRTPVVEVVGEGEATVFRDGRAWPSRWFRPDRAAPTTFRFAGQPIAMSGLPVWVLLVPPGQPVATR